MNAIALSLRSVMHKLFHMPEKSCQSSNDESVPTVCLQKVVLVALLSFVICFAWLAYWFVRINGEIGLPTTWPSDVSVEDVVNMGLQRQLFWGVVALSSFIGYFQFLAVIGKENRKWVAWFPLYEVVFWGFVLAQTVSITRIADLVQWVYELEQYGNIPIISNFFEDIFHLFPLFVMLFCGFLWFVFLGLFIERRYKRV